MSESASRTPVPEAPASDAEICDEQSSVRPKMVAPEAATPSRRPAESGEWDSAKRVQRSGRLEQLVRLARVLLADLPADDTRARLLRVAMVRRDETLLERLMFGDARGSRPPTK